MCSRWASGHDRQPLAVALTHVAHVALHEAHTLELLNWPAGQEAAQEPSVCSTLAPTGHDRQPIVVALTHVAQVVWHEEQTFEWLY